MLKIATITTAIALLAAPVFAQDINAGGSRDLAINQGSGQVSKSGAGATSSGGNIDLRTLAIALSSAGVTAPCQAAAGPISVGKRHCAVMAEARELAQIYGTRAAATHLARNNPRIARTLISMGLATRVKQ